MRGSFEHARRRAWVLWTIVMSLTILAGAVRLSGAGQLLENLDGPHWWAELIWWNALVPLGVLSFATVGALIVARHPSNRLGYFALALAGAASIHDTMWQYAVQSMFLETRSLPLAGFAGWLSHAIAGPILVLGFALVLLHFPTGRLINRRWRVTLWAALGLLLLNFAGSTLNALSRPMFEPIRPSALTIDLAGGAGGWIHGMVELGTAVVLISAVASVFIRWFAAEGVQRLQLKWLGFVGAIMAVAMTSWIVSVLLTGDSFISMAALSMNLGMVTIGVPLAVGVAILRYRLFDIDVVINRTLVYGSLTIILGTSYVGSVLVLQFLLGRILGGQDIAIVVSTLFAVAAVRPARDQIQRAVDRRFFRQKYDASATLSRLGRDIQEEVDLDRLQCSMTRVIEETMQPNLMSVWLADSGHGSGIVQPVTDEGT